MSAGLMISPLRISPLRAWRLVCGLSLGLCLAAPSALAAPVYETTPAGNSQFLADYAARSDVIKRPSGLMYRVLESGTGPSPINMGDEVTVEYMGFLISGKPFDRTRPGQPATFRAGRLIPGWVEALSLMKTGDRWELVIPAGLGYGAKGAGDTIPPDQTLVFVMKLLKVAYAP